MNKEERIDSSTNRELLVDLYKMVRGISDYDVITRLDSLVSRIESLEVVSKHDTLEIESIRRDILDISNLLKDPLTGVIVKLEQIRAKATPENINELEKRVDSLSSWRSGVNKALWFTYAAITGILLKLILQIRE